jgi:hypothetical protein
LVPAESAPGPPPTTVYVRAASNALAVAALVLGIIGALAGLIPLLFLKAFSLGATALRNDGTYSYAAHHQGACSHHGGVAVFYK